MKYRAFVSSTYEDLKKHRAHVIASLRRSGFDVDPMEEWTADGDEPKQFSQDRITGCDVCVLLVAYRRGFVPQGETKSITQLEYEESVAQGLEILPFLLEEDTPWKPSFNEMEKDKELGRWRDQLKQSHGVEFFSLEPKTLDVKGAVARWLIKKKGNQSDTTIKDTIDWPKDKSPYPGLFAFNKEYAPLFFGRDADVQEIMQRLRPPEGRFLIISGDSGVGKSSLMRAGVLPKLEGTTRLGNGVIECVTMLPGQGPDPWTALVMAFHQHTIQANIRFDQVIQDLKHAPETLGTYFTKITQSGKVAKTFVLFLDQMEEFFTAQDIDQSTSFLTALYQAARDEAVWVMATIRSDHLHYCHRHPEMVQVLNQGGHYAVAPLRPHMLREMILKPAQAVGLRMSDSFADLLIQDTGKDAANLPLLAFTLNQLVENRTNHELNETLYNQIGGVTGAVAAHAKKAEETIKKEMGGSVHDFFREIFQVLANVQKQESLPTRNRPLLQDIPPRLQKVVQFLIRERLLQSEGEGEAATVSIAHEKLFEAWPALKDYVEQNKKTLVDRTLLESRARKWVDMGRPWFSGLSSGREYRDFHNAGRAQVGTTKEFLQASRRARGLWLGVGILMVFSIGLVTWLWQKEYDLDQAMLKVQSFGMSIHKEPAKMVPIPGDEFRQGDVEGLGEGWRNPVRTVAVQPFLLSKYEVTFGEYDRFAIATNRDLPNDQGWGRGKRPVINVSWEDAKAYANWLAKQTNTPYRLPSESEWEYTARSGKKQEVWAGTSAEETLGAYAVYNENSGNRTARVGSKKANAFGIHDQSGNVWEWVEDCLHASYARAPVDGSPWLEAGEGDCSKRMIRGGSWGDRPEVLRSSFRTRLNPDDRSSFIGFRLAQDISD